MFKAGVNSGALTSPRGPNISSSNYGKAVKLVYGLTQVSPDLVWYNDWEATDHPTNPKLQAVLGNGGKSKKQKKSGTQYYSAAMDFLIGHSPIRGVLTIWYNNQAFLVFKTSASGVVSGGQFTFTPSSLISEIVVSAMVSGPSFQVTEPNFVADRRVRDATLGDNFYLERSAPGLPPNPNEYTVTSGGLYTFNASQGGHDLRITYFTSNPGSGTPATLAGIFAVTIHEDFSETFNDFGGPGSLTVFGTWERPLWNESFAVPGRIDAGAYTARRPYSFNWDGVNPTVNVPAALNGKPITVYYGIPAIFKSDGTLLTGTLAGVFTAFLTPMALLKLEFEQQFASGAEYANHSTEQLIQRWCAGAGSVRFDLGAANAVPNLNFETIGAFTQWPSGDADVADVIADIVASGPVLP